MKDIAKLYDSLMGLCNTNDAFFFKDFLDRDGYTYRIFNYRLATYTDFMNPGAMECRGIMFRFNKDGSMTCVSRPMEKFFNAGENPYTMDLDYSGTRKIMLKEDGSLISTWIDVLGFLRLKTKGSLTSEQATDAERWLSWDANRKFREDLHTLNEDGWTVNMEWVAPWNRIIMSYSEPKLVVLNVRHCETGDYLAEECYPESVYNRSVGHFTMHLAAGVALSNLVEYVHGLEGFEGVVVQLPDRHVKIKTKWYSHLHAAKDSIDNPKALIATILSEGIDDLRAIFVDDSYVINKIDKYEALITHAYNFVYKRLEQFHAQWKDSSRKDYAIAAKEYWVENDSCFFGVQMNMVARPEQSVSQGIKDTIMKNYKMFVLPEDKGLIVEE